jgi:hypothetical protein
MSADRLRQAAQKIRETAKAATPGPWGHDDTGVYVTDRLDPEGLAQPDADAEVAQCYSMHQEADAALIALMASPPVALAVADSLDDAATDLDRLSPGWKPRESTLRLVDLILGGAQ